MASFKQTQRNKQQGQPDSPTMEQLQGMDQSQLMQALLAERDRAKAAGTLNEQTIQQFWDTVSPSLSEEQREKMKGLLALLR